MSTQPHPTLKTSRVEEAETRLRGNLCIESFFTIRWSGAAIWVMYFLFIPFIENQRNA